MKSDRFHIKYLFHVWNDLDWIFTCEMLVFETCISYMNWKIQIWKLILNINFKINTLNVFSNEILFSCMRNDISTFYKGWFSWEVISLHSYAVSDLISKHSMVKNLGNRLVFQPTSVFGSQIETPSLSCIYRTCHNFRSDTQREFFRV